MTFYYIPIVVSQSSPNEFTPKNVEWVFLLTGIWPFNADVFTDKDFLPSAVSDSPLQDSKQKSAVLEVSSSNWGVNTHSSTSGLNAGPSTSARNDHHLSPVDIRPFPQAGIRKKLARENPEPVLL